jgi:VCBS repeat protein
LRPTAVIALALFLFAAAPVEASFATLAWDRNSESTVTGYVILYGTRPGVYTSQVDVGNRTQYTLLSIQPGTYYFAVKAYTAGGVTSPPSAEVSSVVQPLTLPTTPAPDLDGDKASDQVVWRGPTGTWYWLSSGGGWTDATARSKQWGNQSLGDVALTGDIDGDKTTDLVLWRASTGTWYWLTSSTNYNYASAGSKQWGNLSLGDVPMLADIDGDALADLIVWRASTGTWHWLTSSSDYDYAAAGAKQWGNQGLGDVPLLGDYDGDGRTDLSLWRPTDGTWYWLTSSTNYNYASAGSKQWGNSGLSDKPMVGDFDGDHKSDLAIWRASDGTWYWLTSSSGYAYTSAVGVQWGNRLLGDVAALTDFDGDGKADLCVWRSSTGTWFWLTSSSGYAYGSAGVRQWGSLAAGDIPIIR